MDQTRYKSKSWVIKSRFSFNVRQHGQQQLYLQYCKLNSLQYNRCSFIFTTLLVHTTTPAISAKIPVLYFSHFSPPYSTLICSQNHFYNPHYTPFLHTSSISYLFIFGYSHPNNLHQKHFRYLNQLANSSCLKGTLWSLVRTDTGLISLFFLKVWQW